MLCAAIQEAAAHVLARDGYEGVSTRSIAERAGVSIGSVYQYFRDKDAVLDALTAMLLDRLVEALEPALALESAPLGRRVELLLSAATTVLAPYPSVLRHLSAVRGTPFTARLGDARRRALEGTRAMLELHRAELTVSDAGLAARILVDMGEGLLLNLGAHDDRQRVVAEATRMVVRYCTG